MLANQTINLSFDELIHAVERDRAEGKKVVLCHGVFDLLHLGHIRHLNKARELGDVLVVTVTPDVYVNKGPGRPAFSEELRAEAIAALESVDYVAVNKWATAVHTIESLKPDIYVKGSDYREASEDKTEGIIFEKEAIESVGGELVFTDEITFSSSSLINKHMPLFSQKMNSYLKEFTSSHSYREIEENIEELKGLKVLVVGESIIDDYHYCRTMGKSGKDPILAACYQKSETFVGGVLAVANHVASFCDDVSVLSFLGNKESYEPFIRKQMNEKIDLRFMTMHNRASTIVKRRFLEHYPFQKLFEVYIMDDDEACEEDSSLLEKNLKELLPQYDVVIVTDYGHGMFTPKTINLLCSEAKFLAVNTQVNAGNQGFNTCSKYPRADFICISENELRIDVRSKQRPLEEIVNQEAVKSGFSKFLITRGNQGVVCFDKKEGYLEIPAFSGKIIDRVGAGDSVLAVSSLCVARDCSMDVVGLLGNAVGFHTVQTMCNRSAIDKLALLRTLEHSLK